MIKEETLYVTPDDYATVYGESLRKNLRSNDNESNQAEIFIRLVTTHLKAWVDNNSFRRISYDSLTEYQSEQWKRAILAQVYYCMHEGVKALGLSSGIDDERGIVVDIDTLSRTEICNAALDHLSNSGLLNFVMKNRARTMGNGFWDTGFADGGGSYSAPSTIAANGTALYGIGYTEDE